MPQLENYILLNDLEIGNFLSWLCNRTRTRTQIALCNNPRPTACCFSGCKNQEVYAHFKGREAHSVSEMLNCENLVSLFFQLPNAFLVCTWEICWF